VLWRHGQTTWNTENRFQGQTDIPLNDVGRAQAERAARMVAAFGPELIVSSDLRRALSTAAPLARLTGLPVTPDKDLRERSGGAWEGLTDAEIRQRYPAERAAWTPPDGEPADVVQERVCAALTRIAERLSEGGLAVVVSHGGALRMGMERFLGLSREQSGMFGPMSNCCWSVLGLRRGRWCVLEHNAGTLPEPVLGADARP
jgi:probable phosphoglycerate mutase